MLIVGEDVAAIATREARRIFDPKIELGAEIALVEEEIADTGTDKIGQKILIGKSESAERVANLHERLQARGGQRAIGGRLGGGEVPVLVDRGEQVAQCISRPDMAELVGAALTGVVAEPAFGLSVRHPVVIIPFGGAPRDHGSRRPRIEQQHFVVAGQASLVGRRDRSDGGADPEQTRDKNFGKSSLYVAVDHRSSREPTRGIDAGFRGKPIVLGAAFLAMPRQSRMFSAELYQEWIIMTHLMARGGFPGRRAAPRDAVPSGKRRNAPGKPPRATEGRSAQGPRFVAGGAVRLSWGRLTWGRTTARPAPTQRQKSIGQMGRY